MALRQGKTHPNVNHIIFLIYSRDWSNKQEILIKNRKRERQ